MTHLNIQVLIADGQPVVCEGVRQALLVSPAITVAACVRNAGDLAQALKTGAYNVLIAELSLWNEHNGALTYPQFQRRHPGLGVVLLTRHENAGVVHALLSMGIDCIVSKVDELSHLPSAIIRSHGGGRYLSPRISTMATTIRGGRTGLQTLTPRELEVVQLFLSGLTINEIAERLSRSKKTISTQKGKAMEKLGLERDIELFRYGMETGLARA